MGQPEPSDRVIGGAKEPKSVLCVGGRSFGCRRMEPHATTNKYYCYRCNADLGCKLCAQPLNELICLRCRDNGSQEAEDKHGRMVRDRDLGAEAFALIGKVLTGKISEADAVRTMREGFEKFNR